MRKITVFVRRFAGMSVILFLTVCYALINHWWLAHNRIPLAQDELAHLLIADSYLRIFSADFSAIFSSLFIGVSMQWPPVYHVIAATIQVICGRGYECAVLINVVYFTVTVCALYGIARRVGGTAAGVLAIICFSLYPVVFRYSRVFTPDFLLMMCVALSMFAGVCYLERRTKYFLCAFFFMIGVAVFVKPAAILYMIGPLTFLLFDLCSRTRPTWYLHARRACVFFIVSASLLLFLPIERIPYYNSEWFLFHIRTFFFFCNRMEGPWFSQVLEHLFFYGRALINSELSIPLLVLLIVGGFSFFRSSMPYRGLLLSWYLVPHCILSISRFQQGRYMLAAIAPLAIISAVGCMKASKNLVVRSIVVVCLLLAGVQFVDITFHQDRDPLRTQWNTPVGKLYPFHFQEHEYMSSYSPGAPFSDPERLGDTVAYICERYTGMVSMRSFFVFSTGSFSRDFLTFQRIYFDYISSMNYDEMTARLLPISKHYPDSFDDMASVASVVFFSDNGPRSLLAKFPEKTVLSYDENRDLLHINGVVFENVYKRETPSGLTVHVYEQIGVYVAPVNLATDASSYTITPFAQSLRVRDEHMYTNVLTWGITVGGARYSSYDFQWESVERGEDTVTFRGYMRSMPDVFVNMTFICDDVAVLSCTTDIVSFGEYTPEDFTISEIGCTFSQIFTHWETHNEQGSFQRTDSGGIILQDPSINRFVLARINPQYQAFGVSFDQEVTTRGSALHYNTGQRTVRSFVVASREKADEEYLRCGSFSLHTMTDSAAATRFCSESSTDERTPIISYEGISMKFSNGCAQVLHDDTYISKGFGLYISFRIDDVWYDSQNAVWYYEQLSEKQMRTVGYWANPLHTVHATFDCIDETQVNIRYELTLGDDTRYSEIHTNMVVGDDFSLVAGGGGFQATSEKYTVEYFETSDPGARGICTKRKSGATSFLGFKGTNFIYFFNEDRLFEKGETVVLFEGSVRVSRR